MTVSCRSNPPSTNSAEGSIRKNSFRGYKGVKPDGTVNLLLTGDAKPPQQASRPPIARQIGEVNVKIIAENVRIVSKSDGGGIGRDGAETPKQCGQSPMQGVDGFGVTKRRVVGTDHHVALNRA